MNTIIDTLITLAKIALVTPIIIIAIIGITSKKKKK